MQKIDKIVKQVTDEFQANRGKGSMYCFNSKSWNHIVASVITMFHAKRPNEQILIVVSHYNLRVNTKTYLTKQGITEENGFDIKLITDDYVKTNFNYPQKLIIILGGSNYAKVNFFSKKSNQFILCIFTNPVYEHEFITDLRTRLPNISTDDLDTLVTEDYVYSPVEEHRYGVNLDIDDTKKYNYYTEFINNAVAIFGGLDVLEKCRVGDTENNISAQEYRYNLAVANGWSETLDVHNDFVKQIDEIYNPNAISECANNFYNFTRCRRELLSDNSAKLPVIADIVRKHKEDKILIVSLRGEFAAAVTEYLNNNVEDVMCGDYHDCLDGKYAVDEYGETIYVKSGANKGTPKVLQAQAQSTLNESRFNQNIINVLSIKNASNTKLKIATNVCIITSPMCADITEIKQRFTKVRFSSVPTLIYVIYCEDTVESQKLDKIVAKRVDRKIIEETKKEVLFDENSGSIIL